MSVWHPEPRVSALFLGSSMATFRTVSLRGDGSLQPLQDAHLFGWGEEERSIGTKTHRSFPTRPRRPSLSIGARKRVRNRSRKGTTAPPGRDRSLQGWNIRGLWTVFQRGRNGLQTVLRVRGNPSGIAQPQRARPERSTTAWPHVRPPCSRASRSWQAQKPSFSLPR